MKKLMNNSKGQALIIVILIVLGIFMFILAAPLLYDIIVIGTANTGTATGFFIRATPFVVLVLLVGLAIKALSGGRIIG